MNKLQSSVKDIIQEAEQLNKIKLTGITELQDRLSTCPDPWVSVTKNFIKIVSANITNRNKLIEDLRNKFIVNSNPQRLIDITYELQALDHKDVIAANMYSAIIDEGI